MFNRKRLKKENEELRKRVKEFDMVLSCIPFNIFLKDTNSVYRVVSEESAKNNKMDREDMIGKSDNELFETSPHADEFVVDDQYIIKNKVDSHSLTPYYEEGFVRYYNIYKKPYINIHGEVEGIFGMVSYSLPAMEQDLRTVLPGIDIIYDYETIVFDYDFVNKRISIVKEVEDFSESIPTLLRYPLENENYIKAHDYSKIRKGILRFDEMNSKTSEFKFLFKMKNNQNEWKNCILFSKKISTEDRIARHAIGIITVLDNEWWSDRLFQWVRREEFGEVVEVLADMYHAVYILNVEEETFETIKYPWNSPDREFGVVDFKTGMESLIEKVIPEKRKAFFELYGLLKLKEAMKDGPDKIYHEFQMEGLDGYIWMSVTAISLNSNRIVLLLQNIDQRVRVDKRNRHISNITGMIFRDYCEHIYEISLSTGQCFYFTTDEFNFYRKSIGKIEDNIDSILNKCHPDDSEFVKDIIKIEKFLLLTEKNPEEMFECRGANDEWYIVTIRRIIIENNVEVFIIIKNNTRLKSKELEDKKLLHGALEEAQKANKAKSEFLANMSHEIRTPLNGILGMNQIIMRESLEIEIKEHAKVIETSGKILMSLIDDILDFSKIETGKMELNQSQYSFDELIKNITSIISMRTKDKYLIFRTEINPHLPSGLYGDEIRIKQILMNLLSNAVKYTREGEVVLDIDYDFINEELIELIISVSDTGVGMRQNEIGKIFETFERLDIQKNRNIQGTGLGMGITKRLLDMMGGVIEIESVYGVGSKFLVRVRQGVWSTVPVGGTSVEAIIEKNHTIGKEDNKIEKNVLLIDDNKINIVVASRMLTSIGCKIDVAMSGYEGIEKACENRYDIIFMDHLMPGIDGVEALSMLQSDGRNKNNGVPIISLTANATVGVREFYLEAGFHDYISKPIEYEKLEGIITKYANNRERIVDK